MNTIWERITEIINNNKGKRGWHRAAGVLAAFIIFGVTYALILPAITLEDETAYEEPGMFFEEEAAVYEEPAYEEEYFEEPVYEEAEYEEPAYEEDAVWVEEEEYQEDAFDQADEDAYATTTTAKKRTGLRKITKKITTKKQKRKLLSIQNLSGKMNMKMSMAAS